MKDIKKISIIILMLVVGLVLGYVGFMIVTDYKPEAEVSISIENNQTKDINKQEEIKITTFNTGYSGIDQDIDFFMDGGTMSRASSKDQVNNNLDSMIKEMKNLDSDVYFLQEVDKNSTRSYEINQYEEYKKQFLEYEFMYSINYKVPWVPIPLSEPHGKVLSGITTMSKYKIDNVVRYDLPGKESFIRQLGDLDRCMMVSRKKLDNNKELVLINAHLSAYDEGGKIRVQQLGFLEEFLNKEYEKGNYVILGGDFNQQIPGTSYTDFATTQEKPNWLQDIPQDFNPNGYTWAVDKNIATSRTIDVKYTKDENLLSIIDGFLISDNIEVVDVYGSDLGFENSDHNPVTVNIKLK